MKRLIAATLIAGIGLAGAPVVTAQAQTGYWSHPKVAHTNYGYSHRAYGRIHLKNGYLNGRQAPGRGWLAIGYFTSGEVVRVQRIAHSNGEQWVLVESQIDHTRAWILGDYVWF